MYIHGSFINKKGDECSLHIVTNADRTDELEIGTEASGVWFSDDPITISNDMNDTFDALLRHSASVNLLCRELIADFFCKSCRDAVVNIYVGEECVFAGFIEPLSYSQPYASNLDEVTLSCVDVLSALQYSKYKDIGAAGVDYDTVKGAASNRTFMEIAAEIFTAATGSLDILGTGSVRFMFDGSKALDSTDGNKYTIFSQVAIADLLFLGDEEDDVWQQDEIIEEMMKYLNLHIVQYGLTFYIFSWETVTSIDTINWVDLAGGSAETTAARSSINITLDNVADDGAQVEIGEAYNQLLLTDEIEKTESIIDSPLDDGSLTSPFRSKQKVLTEYSADGEGKKATRAIFAMVHGEDTDFGDATQTDWYLQVKKHAAWRFPINGSIDTDDIYDTYCADGTNQQQILQYLGTHLGAAILSWGKITINKSKDDNSLVSTVSMDDYFVVSVNGNAIDNNEAATYPTAAALLAASPVAVYTGNSAGGVFSPADSETTNYIVISGKVVLNPIMETSAYKDYAYTTRATFKEARQSYNWNTTASDSIFIRTVPSRNNDDGRYYMRQYWEAEKPNDAVTWDEDGDTGGLYPYTGDGPEQYEFKYSAIGDDDKTDTISKVSVLQCMLIIGKKCVVEKTPDNDLGTGVAYTGEGLPQDFVWCDYKERADCASDDEYYAQSFSIGFNPKIGDKLIGTEYDLQNNHDYTLNIDEDGIAIPITAADKISGVVQFMILGPVNLTWDEITRRHGSFWRHTKWGSTSVPLMAHVSSIMMKELEIKVYSDGGLVDASGDTDNDVVYMSDTDEAYINRKDDISFKFTTTLTSSEAHTLGVSNDIKLSAPISTETETGLLSIYDANKRASGKSEQIYVDSYYNEYHAPLITLTQNMEDAGAGLSPFAHYVHPALGKEFYITGISRNIMNGTAELKMKERWYNA